MSLNLNATPTLKLHQYPTQDHSGDLFEKFVNPQNSTPLSLKQLGTVTAVFKEKLESSKLELNGLYSGELSCRSTFLSDLFDPRNKLKSLIEEGKIIKIHGNCTVDQAQVILLDDTNHLDRDQQSVVRGKVANALKGSKNIFLCEGHPPSKFDFSLEEIRQYFAPNLELNQGGSKDYLSGWDDMYLYKQSLQSVVRGFQQMNIAHLPTRVNGLLDLDSVTGKICELRTQALWHSLKEKHSLFPDAKMIIFGGQAHLRDKRLHEQLIAQHLRFVEVTPIDVMPLSEKIEKIQNYYQVESYSMWGNRR